MDDQVNWKTGWKWLDHAQGDGKTIGGFHIGGFAEIQYHAGTAEKQEKVDARDIDLSAFFGRENHPHFGPEVESHGLADN